jgi:MYXO-CTERM domain-containing protein
VILARSIDLSNFARHAECDIARDSTVRPLKPFVEDVMAALRTGMRIIGIALTSLCLSTAARGQVLFSGSAAGCFGFVCAPITSFATFPGNGLTPRWVGLNAPTGSIGFGGFPANQNAQGDQDGDQGEDGLGAPHFNAATPAFTGIAVTLFAFMMNSHGDTPANGVETPVTLSSPLTAHLDFGETSALVATPEPMSGALTATGLLALGAAVLLRRRRRPIA